MAEISTAAQAAWKLPRSTTRRLQAQRFASWFCLRGTTTVTRLILLLTGTVHAETSRKEIFNNSVTESHCLSRADKNFFRPSHVSWCLVWTATPHILEEHARLNNFRFLSFFPGFSLVFEYTLVSGGWTTLFVHFWILPNGSGLSIHKRPRFMNSHSRFKHLLCNSRFVACSLSLPEYLNLTIVKYFLDDAFVSHATGEQTASPSFVCAFFNFTAANLERTTLLQHS